MTVQGQEDNLPIGGSHGDGHGCCEPSVSQNPGQLDPLWSELPWWLCSLFLPWWAGRRDQGSLRGPASSPLPEVLKHALFQSPCPQYLLGHSQDLIETQCLTQEISYLKGALEGLESV